MTNPAKLIPDRRVAARYGVSLRTLDRWDNDPRMAQLGWPEPVRIRCRKYRNDVGLDTFDENCAAAGRQSRGADT